MAKIQNRKTFATNIHWFSNDSYQSTFDSGDVAATSTELMPCDFDTLLELITECRVGDNILTSRPPTEAESFFCNGIDNWDTASATASRGAAQGSPVQSSAETTGNLYRNGWEDVALEEGNKKESSVPQEAMTDQNNNDLTTSETKGWSGARVCQKSPHKGATVRKKTTRKVTNKFSKPKLRKSVSSDSCLALSMEAASPLPSTLKLPKLCRFLLSLLQQPDQYPCVTWKDKEDKIFKIVNPKEVANMWGSTKQKPEMKYEHFARTLRGYVSRGLLKKPRRKLYYQFTENVQVF